jgi:hypothetical protein
MPYDDDDLDNWYEDFIGANVAQINRKGGYWALTPEERKELLSRGGMKTKVRQGALMFMNRRRIKGLGSYNVDNHVVVDRERELHRRFLSRIGAFTYRVDRVTRKTKGGSVSITVYRDSRGRFVKKLRGKAK